MKQKALKQCDRYTTKYAECASGRTISVVWQCRLHAVVLQNSSHSQLLLQRVRWEVATAEFS
ncbi:hypothetical protein KY285_013297 [Solanum tuberosum]|nr:hypothetical protein KY284_013292 [Solanum tuberosum]KAH0717266.1 hypothetical protein KY285_013297 [Solanum tuberosum]